MVKRRGFTLVELLIGMTIFIVVAGAITDASIQSWRSYLLSQSLSQLQRANRTTIDQVDAVSQGATTVVASLTVGNTTYTTGASTIVLRLPPVDSSDNILSGDDDIVITQQGVVIQEIVVAANGSARANLPSPKTLNSLASSFVITYLDALGHQLTPGTDDLATARQLSFTVTSSQTTFNTVSNRSLSSTIYLRNKGNQ